MELAEKAAAAIELIVGIPERQRAYLPCARIHAVIEFPPDDDARPDTRPNGQSNHIVGSLPLTVAPGPKCETVGIVVDGYGHTEVLLKYRLQVYLFPRWYVGHVVHDAPMAVHHRRHTDTDARDLRTHQLGNLPSQLVGDHVFSLSCRTWLYDGVDHGGSVDKTDTHVSSP